MQRSRRELLAIAGAFGASLAWAGTAPVRAQSSPIERRDLFPEGVASGDPGNTSILLWTRRPHAELEQARLRVEVSTDETFRRLVVAATANIEAASDWTCRVLVGNLRPATVYWYRFIDGDGNASRAGRTITAPADDDRRPVRFAFASCQNANAGVLHAYRRMIVEDQRAAEGERLGFVLHLGDFIYEMVWHPEDNPQGYAGRPVRDLVRFETGEKITTPNLGTFEIPTTLADYRACYRAHLHDQDLQDARARWPFVCIWDNHEFSLSSWQSFQTFNQEKRARQTLKAASNQAWFEYVPSRVTRAGGRLLQRFDPPATADAPIELFDERGFGDEPNNRAAVASLIGYRTLRYGRNIELLLTDQHSYRSEPQATRREAGAFRSPDFPRLFPQEAMEILDQGRVGHPPDTIRFGGEDKPNFAKGDPPQTILGETQKRWFVDRLTSSRATWKIWANPQGTLDQRADPQNLPPGLGPSWPGAGYAVMGGIETDVAYGERAEIYAAVRKAGITGFATVCGNRHSFWAGFAAPTLPPKPFEPIGVAFVGAAISSPGVVEELETSLPATAPWRQLLLADRPGGDSEPTINMLNLHGVRACLEYARNGDIDAARALSNAELAPHLKFVDHAGHGYATVSVTSEALECEFVCIPRPISRNPSADGPPIHYRVVHHVPLWKPGTAPRMDQRVLEGDPKLSL